MLQVDAGSTTATTTAWHERSACSRRNWAEYISEENPHDPEVFFPKRVTGGQCAPAKALCARCPVRLQCLTEGLRESNGVWGGLSEKDRRVAQRMVKKGMTLPEVLAHFDALRPKRQRQTALRPPPAPVGQVRVFAATVVHERSLASRAEERRRNGLW